MAIHARSNLGSNIGAWGGLALAVALLVLCLPAIADAVTDTIKPRGSVTIRVTTAGTDATDAAGQALLELKCGSCHSSSINMINMVEDASYSTLSEWQTLVTRMVAKGAALSSAEQASLAAYLDRSYGDNAGDLYTATSDVRLYHRAYDRPLGGTSADGGVVAAFRVSNDGLFRDVAGEEAFRSYAPWSDWKLTPGDGPKLVHVQFNDDSGNRSSSNTDKIILDTRAPVVKVTTPKISSQLHKTNAFRTTWLGQELGVAVSGIDEYVVERRTVPKGVFTTWKTGTTASSGITAGTPGATYEFRARATDLVGNVGSSSTARKTTIPYDDNQPKYTGKWTRKSSLSTGQFMGTARTTRSRGAKMTMRFKGNSVALLVTRGPRQGKTAIYIDGKFLKTVDTRASKLAYRQVIELKSFPPYSSHRVTAVNRGTFGRPNLEIDGVIVAR